MIDLNSSRGKAFLSCLETRRWTIETFLKSGYNTFYISNADPVHKYCYTREEMMILRAHFLVTDDPRAEWLT